MILAHALGKLPQWAASELGQKATQAAFADAGLSLHYLHRRDGYIPETALARFLARISKEAGDEKFGAGLFGLLSVRDYGIWGAYILSAPTLGAALKRARNSLHMHSTYDTVRLFRRRSLATFEYRFRLGRGADYETAAYCAVSVISSIHQHFLGAAWRPSQVDIDMPRPDRVNVLEDVFNCPVHFDRPSLAVLFPASQLAARNPQSTDLVLTLQDVVRAYQAAPRCLTDQIFATLATQIEDYGVDIERVSQSMGLSVRTLQRHLNADGTSFRQVANQVVLSRGIELLEQTQLDITAIAGILNYSASNNFSRFFSNMVGVSPSEYRAQKRLVRV